MNPLFLTSRLLRARHGFSVRTGGVSRAPFASLNLGEHVNDSPEDVRENLSRFHDAAGLAPGSLFTTTQVHGDTVLDAPEASASFPPTLGDADALISRRPGIAVGVRTADCVPLLLEADSGEVAAVHAGWRGTEAEIVLRTIEQLKLGGAGAYSVRVAIGPAIGACCYEVSRELAAAFQNRFGGSVIVAGEGEDKPHLDLVAALRVSLTRAGVPDENIDVLGVCTACDSTRFFSHRRDCGATGRHLSFIRCEQRANS